MINNKKGGDEIEKIKTWGSLKEGGQQDSAVLRLAKSHG